MEATPRLIPSECTRTDITLHIAVGRLFLRLAASHWEGRKVISSPGTWLLIMSSFTLGSGDGLRSLPSGPLLQVSGCD